MTRTFIALEMSEALQDFLGELLRHMARELPNVRWVDPAGIHLTLAFLGELSDEQLLEATSAAEVAAQQVTPFSYRLSHLGVFGSPRQPRVIWAGIEEPTGKLAQLHRVLNRELEQRGFEVDTRPFSPHLTLSRVKAPLTPVELQRLQRLLAETHIAKSSPTHHVHSLNVMKSELLRTGARYTCLRAFRLGVTAEM
jgi:RNA 2',3'-cyclic 3'-phosphodiesterase